MDKMIVVVFDTEEQAYQGSRALQELADDGSIALYASAVISKNEDGKAVLEDAEDEGPLGTSVGMLAGSLIGLLGGPVGFALGASGGAMIGSIDDFKKAGVSSQFLEDVSHKLLPGFSAVVAEIAEQWTAPINSEMEKLDGVVLRCRRAEVIEDQMEREIAAEKAELAALNAEWDQAVGDVKTKVRASIEHVESKLKSGIEKAWEHAEKLEREADAKIAKLQAQIVKASGDAREKLEAHINAIRQDYDRRIQKLKEAGKLTSEALG